MQRLSNPPKGPRGSAPSSRPGSGARGGIQKRGRASTPRLDKDGDLILDADVARSRVGKGRLNSPSLADRASSTTSTRGSTGRAGSKLANARTQAAIIRGMEGRQANIKNAPRSAQQYASLQIHGLAQSKAASNSDGGLQSLLSWIQRKADAKTAKRSGVKIIKSRITSDSTVFITASPEDIITIRILDGFEFAGATLSIKADGPVAEEVLEKAGWKEESSETKGVRERLKAVLAERYNSEMKLLNLSGLASDPGLKDILEGTKKPSKVFPALMAICDGLFKSLKEKAEAVESVSLADNGLTTVEDVEKLADTFPDLKHLDLSRNDLADMAALRAWKRKFTGLVTLVLAGNPIEQQLGVLSNDILTLFPNLQIINNIQVRTADDIAAAKSAAKNMPCPVPIGPADFRDVSQVGENFIRALLPLYDNDRQALINTYYDPDSRVSIAVNMTAPHDKKLSGVVPKWEPYVKHSRNLTKITHLPPRMARQYRGQQRIMELWKDLPATRHPDISIEPLKYTIECNSIPGLVDPSGASPAGVDGLLLMVHGEFEEANGQQTDKAMRSFSRTFIIGPGATPQQPIRVVSDMMTLRPWSPLAQPATDQVIPTGGPAVVQLPQTNIGQTMSEDQIQQAMANEVMGRTGMTLEYAVMCLKQTAWNMDQALVAFAENRDKLPPNAFVAQ